MRDTRLMLTEFIRGKLTIQIWRVVCCIEWAILPLLPAPKKRSPGSGGYSIPLRMAVINHMEDLEGQIRAIQSSLPDFTKKAAARAWADQYEQKALAEKQRDYGEILNFNKDGPVKNRSQQHTTGQQ